MPKKTKKSEKDQEIAATVRFPPDFHKELKIHLAKHYPPNYFNKLVIHLLKEDMERCAKKEQSQTDD